MASYFSLPLHSIYDPPLSPRMMFLSVPQISQCFVFPYAQFYSHWSCYYHVAREIYFRDILCFVLSHPLLYQDV